MFESLRSRIVSLDLPPNTLLSRSDLARDYQVSQTPLRDALQRLEAEGLVAVFPQSRTVVTRLVLAGIAEAQFLRIAVETEVMRRLASDCDRRHGRAARSDLRRDDGGGGGAGRLSAVPGAGRDFPPGAFRRRRSAGALRAAAGPARDRSTGCGGSTCPGRGKIAAILADHRRAIAALAARDAEAAQEAMRAHLSQTIARVDELRAALAGLFRLSLGS